MSNTFEKRYTFPALIIFALPNIIMMIFLSLYTIVDGVFVSRYIGTTALAAVNMIFPVISIKLGIGIMLASGGSAIIARKLGEGKGTEAKRNFTFIVLVALFIGIIAAVIGNLFIEQIIRALGVSELQYELCYTYGRILFCFAPVFFLQTVFQTFFVTAGNPMLGLIATICAGIVNIVLDYVFIALCGMGISGAAIATGIGYCLPTIIGLVYFGIIRQGQLFFVKLKVDGKMLFNSCTNGSSEMVTNLANAVTTFLFNYTFMKYYGEDGVASIAIVLYFQFIFTAVYFGYSAGVAPIISYKYGRGDTKQLKELFRNSISFLIISSVTIYIVSRIIVKSIIQVFTEYGTNVFDITVEGFPIYSTSFLITGISIFASSMFTSFSDGKVSAIISLARTFVFLVGAILILPMLLGEIGVWIAVPVAEGIGIIVSVIFLIVKRNKYKY